MVSSVLLVTGALNDLLRQGLCSAAALLTASSCPTLRPWVSQKKLRESLVEFLRASGLMLPTALFEPVPAISARLHLLDRGAGLPASQLSMPKSRLLCPKPRPCPGFCGKNTASQNHNLLGPHSAPPTPNSLRRQKMSNVCNDFRLSNFIYLCQRDRQ